MKRHEENQRHEKSDENSSLNQYLGIALIIIAAFSRLIPHWPNFTAIGALALFAGSIMGFQLRSILVPIGALFLTDLIFGFHSTMLAVYGAVIFNILLGSILLKKNDVRRTFLVSILGSLVFFFITNFAVWLMDGMYLKTTQGLMTAFAMGLPFLPQQIVGDLFYSAIMFASYYFVINRKKIIA